MRAISRKAILALSLGSAFACGGKGTSELREWRPDDHQPPPAVMPEGQGAAEESGDPNARAAGALFSMRCASCHGEGGRGDGSGRPPAAQLPDFADHAFQAARSDQQLHDVIAKGRGMMPAFGSEITEKGIAALIAHIRSLGAER